LKIEHKTLNGPEVSLVVGNVSQDYTAVHPYILNLIKFTKLNTEPYVKFMQFGVFSLLLLDSIFIKKTQKKKKHGYDEVIWSIWDQR
jgi:hypothetical protein